MTEAPPINPVGAETPLAEVDPRPGDQTSGSSGSYAVAAGIFASRIAGLVREIAISGFLGVSAVADVFKAALRIPNLLQNLLGEGVLSASFIPVYSRLLEEDEEKANQLAGKILGLLLAVMGAIVVIGVLFARPITIVLTPGFEGEQLDLAVALLRIMFPGIAFLVLSAFCTGVLNSHRRFFLSYASPVMWNAAQIAALVTAGLYGATDVGLAHALAWGVTVGAILEVAIQVPSVRVLTRGARMTLDTRSADVRDVVSRFVPVVIGRGAVQILGYVELLLASLLALGGVSALTYTQVLYLLPISLFGMGVAAAELPELSRLGRGARDVIRDRLHVGTERITFYVALTTAVYVAAGDVIVGVLLERGEFTSDDTTVVWLALATFATGLLATTRSRLLANALFALDRPKLVARIAVFRNVLAAGLGALLMFPLDRFAVVDGSIEKVAPLGFLPLPDDLRLAGDHPHLGIVGLAIGATIASWIEFAVLRGALGWRVGQLEGMGHGARWSLYAAGGVGVLAFGLRAQFDDLPALVTAMAVLVPTGLVYLLITSVMRVPEAEQLLGTVRRRVTNRSH